MFLPDPGKSQELGAPEGRERIVFYGFCSECQSDPDSVERVEARIFEPGALAHINADHAYWPTLPTSEELAERYAIRREKRFHKRRMKNSEMASHSKSICAAEGCNRTRHFYDEMGVGYCKRHADDIGIRPRGKVS